LPGPPRFRRNLWLLLATCVLVFIAMGVQTLILNLYLISLGFREDYLGLFSFANTAGIAGAALVAGRLNNRFGSRRVLLGATLLLGLSSIALVGTVQPIPLLVVAVVNGASLAHIFVPCATFVMDNSAAGERPAAYAGYFTAQSVAMVIGSLLGGALPTLLVAGPVATRDGYVLTLVVAGALAGLGVIPLKLADDSVAEAADVPRARAASTYQQRRQMRRDVLWLVGANALIAGSTGFVIPFLNVFFDKQLGVSTDGIGIIYALGSGAMVVASLSGPPVARRFGTIPTIVLCRAVSVPVLLALGLSPRVDVAAGLYVVRTLFTNMTWPIDNAFTMELVRPDFRSTLAGLRSASWNVAWAVASGLAGVMIVEIGFVSIFVAGAVLMVGGCLAYFLAFRGRQTSTADSSPKVIPATASDA
jgi:predicted MFS family arabinose efflux permease